MAYSPSQVETHIRRFFGDHPATVELWESGPMHQLAPEFRVLAIAPGPKSNLWTYTSLGSGAHTPASFSPLEFLLIAAEPTPRAVELVTMAAWYHSKHGLGVGHTVPIGEPWLPGSACDAFLVSHPYPFGARLELLRPDDHSLHVLWLLPITTPEKDFALANGLEALESRFEESGLRYWDPYRASLV